VRAEVPVTPSTVEPTSSGSATNLAQARAPIWSRQKQHDPGFSDYEAGTSREIPVVLLEPTTPTG